jgi:diacylglycerol O-acyltransferase / wax synthase
VVLAIVSSALRRLLDERGEAVDDPMVAMVPISARGEEDRGTLGNKVSAMLVSLASNLADPVARLAQIAEATRIAKDQARVLPEELFRSWAQLAFPALSSRVARVAANVRLFDHVRPLFNVVVSNIPGPETPLWCAGARLVALYPIGPIIEGVGLNVTVASYDGTVYFGVLGCRELVPEVEHVTAHIDDALAELVKAATKERGTRDRRPGGASARRYGR